MTSQTDAAIATTSNLFIIQCNTISMTCIVKTSYQTLKLVLPSLFVIFRANVTLSEKYTVLKGK